MVSSNIIIKKQMKQFIVALSLIAATAFGQANTGATDVNDPNAVAANDTVAIVPSSACLYCRN